MSDRPFPAILSGFSEIASEYDAAICDVWGVLHDGERPFLAAADALRHFRAERGPVVLLSNAPRLADGVEEQFDRIGVPRDFYDAIVTSGSAARADLSARTENGHFLKLFYLGPPRDNPLFHGLRVQLVGAGEADAVLCTGFWDDETETPEDYRSMLADFRKRNLPFLCANPDLVVQRGEKLIPCAGAIARLYETMGGSAIYYGKPHAAVFEAALAAARAKGAATHPIMIGDGLETDILGANRVGWDALFVAGGIHGAQTGGDSPGIAEFLRGRPLSVRAAMRALRW
jgi:HAD superfamily hydrolase (TIGR01459 family)